MFVYQNREWVHGRKATVVEAKVYRGKYEQIALNKV